MVLDKFRSHFNRVEGAFDRDTILQELHFSRDCGDETRPITAKQALHLILPVVRELDHSATLKMIVSEKGIDLGGASPVWEFFFDLVSRRAQLAAQWRLMRRIIMGLPSFRWMCSRFPPRTARFAKW